MYKEGFGKSNYYSDRNSEDVYSIPVRAGKRTYFFDVKSTKGNRDFYLTITESKRRTDTEGGFAYDKHKIFLYKEDFDKFIGGLEEAIAYMKDNLLSDVPMHNGPAAEASASQAGPKEEDKGEDESDFTNVNFEEL